VAIPKNRKDPTLCKGGWFYVNAGSLYTVAEVNGNNIVTVTRAQLVAALKLMNYSRKKPQSQRGTEPC
jgi:hypothetical protein